MKKSVLIYIFPAALILHLFYCLYIQFHHHTSWTLIFPLLVVGIISGNQYKYRVYKRRCLAKCFIVPGTWPYRIMQGRVFSLVISIGISTVYAASLMSFIALKSWLALFYVIMSVVCIGIFYWIVYPAVKRWVASDISYVAAIKLISLLSFLVILPMYLWTAFNTPIPHYIDLSSLPATIANATAQTGALCPVTNFFLKAIHELEAIFYYYSATSSKTLEQNWIKFLIWSLFFIKSSFVFLAMSRFNAEVILMILKFGHAQQSRQNNDFTDIPT